MFKIIFTPTKTNDTGIFIPPARFSKYVYYLPRVRMSEAA